MKAVLVLENGSVFEGRLLGTPRERIGKVILNTAVVGYQEIITDPSNAGKIIVFTYPLIGNYGVSGAFCESEKCRVESVIMKENSRTYSNWQAEKSLEDFLCEEGVTAMEDVDTRTLSVRIRDAGEILGIVSSVEMRKSILLRRLKDYKKREKNDFIKEISTKRIKRIKGSPLSRKIAILDLGILNSFVEQLKVLGCNITLLPYNTSANKIIGLKQDGLIVSSGPEDDEAIAQIAETVKQLIGRIPVLGISAGCNAVCLAVGGKLRKMKTGHRGSNYPVKPLDSYKGDITVQNHSYVLDEDSIKNRRDVRITLRNVNDGSIEEIESTPLKLIAAHYYPVSPCSGEVNEVFIRFLRLIKKQH